MFYSSPHFPPSLLHPSHPSNTEKTLKCSLTALPHRSSSLLPAEHKPWPRKQWKLYAYLSPPIWVTPSILGTCPVLPPQLCKIIMFYLHSNSMCSSSEKIRLISCFPIFSKMIVVYHLMPKASKASITNFIHGCID